MAGELANKITELMQLGIDVTFHRDMSQVRIELLDCNNNEEVVALPFDHLAEHKIVNYLDLMQLSIMDKYNKGETGNNV